MVDYKRVKDASQDLKHEASMSYQNTIISQKEYLIRKIIKIRINLFSATTNDSTIHFKQRFVPFYDYEKGIVI